MAGTRGKGFGFQVSGFRFQVSGFRFLGGDGNSILSKVKINNSTQPDPFDNICLLWVRYLRKL
jgi:hypothetical protein